MQIGLPSDCGNAPRITIVGDFVASWAKADSAAVSKWLTDTATWSVIGGDTLSGPALATQALPTLAPERVVITAIVTHGRLASCDGYLEQGRERLHFCHVFRFAGSVKTSKIAEIRTYLVADS